MNHVIYLSNQTKLKVYIGHISVFGIRRTESVKQLFLFNVETLYSAPC